MARTKTRPTAASVDEYLAARASAAQLEDCRALTAMCERATNSKPHMWGPSIVGFGSYTYTYESGHSGQAPLAGFAVRGRDLVVYLNCESPAQARLLKRLGNHKMGKSCLHLKRLAELDTRVLEQLIAGSVAETRSRYPAP
jgi:hypothetical protein